MSNTTDQTPQASTSSIAREIVGDATATLSSGCQMATEHYVTEPAKDLFSLAKDYAKEKPEVATVWAFGLGVLVGWKIKPW